MFTTHHFHSWFSFIVSVKIPSKNNNRIGQLRYQNRGFFLNVVTCQIAIKPWDANTNRVIIALIVAKNLAIFHCIYHYAIPVLLFVINLSLKHLLLHWEIQKKLIIWIFQNSRLNTTCFYGILFHNNKANNYFSIHWVSFNWSLLYQDWNKSIVASEEVWISNDRTRAQWRHFSNSFI